MNILFYYSSNKRTIPIDIPLLELKKRGDSIFLLTTADRGSLHDLYKSHAIHAEAHPVHTRFRLLHFFRQVLYLIKFCKRHRIDIVHSHLQQANVISVFASFFCKARIIVFRHHCKFHFLLPSTELHPTFNERLGDMIINMLAKKIVVPSQSVKDVMVKYECVNNRKIDVIPYIYDFNSMKEIDGNVVSEIKSAYPARLRLIMVSRLTPYKRHTVVLSAVIPLIKSGYKIQLLIMDEGPEKNMIERSILDAGVSENIHLLGFRHNILDYMAACDVLIHPSLTEASNSAVKEAGLLGKVVMVCNHVGDFNDYIEHKVNGFLLPAGNFAEEAQRTLKQIYNEEEKFALIGMRLQEVVVDRFKKSDNIVNQYKQL